jgi:hypothetical protein
MQRFSWLARALPVLLRPTASPRNAIGHRDREKIRTIWVVSAVPLVMATCCSKSAAIASSPKRRKSSISGTRYSRTISLRGSAIADLFWRKVLLLSAERLPGAAQSWNIHRHRLQFHVSRCARRGLGGALIVASVGVISRGCSRSRRRSDLRRVASLSENAGAGTVSGTASVVRLSESGPRTAASTEIIAIAPPATISMA